MSGPRRLRGGFGSGKQYFELPDWAIELGGMLAYFAMVAAVFRLLGWI